MSVGTQALCNNGLREEATCRPAKVAKKLCQVGPKKYVGIQFLCVFSSTHVT